VIFQLFRPADHLDHAMDQQDLVLTTTIGHLNFRCRNIGRNITVGDISFRTPPPSTESEAAEYAAMCAKFASVKVYRAFNNASGLLWR
jgi:hypothetical protein